MSAGDPLNVEVGNQTVSAVDPLVSQMKSGSDCASEAAKHDDATAIVLANSMPSGPFSSTSVESLVVNAAHRLGRQQKHKSC